MATQGVTPTTKVKGDISQIGLQVGNLCKTTGWYNNCGLNSLTHFLVAKLSAMSAGDLDIFLARNPEYFSLLDSFHQYYGLQAQYGWQDILRLLREHPVATDQEAIFAPVLRLHLGKILTEHAEALWMTDASSAISDYLKSGEIKDIARPVYQSNKPFFDTLRERFEKDLISSLHSDPTPEELEIAAGALRFHSGNAAIPDYQPTQEDILRHVIFQRRNTLEENYLAPAQQYWHESGCQHYADYIANMNHQVMVSVDHLQFICQKLNIGLEVYTPASIQRALEDRELAAHTHGAQWVPEAGAFRWVMKVLNSGIHWIYQEPDNDQVKVTTHNQHYPDELTAKFLDDDMLSGRFKIIGPRAMSKELIIADIKCRLGELSPEELVEIKGIEAIATGQRLAAIAISASKMPEKIAPTMHASGLLTEIYTILDATEIGKRYIALLTENKPDAKEVLQIFNQHFQGGLAKAFLDIYGNEKNYSRVAQLNKASKIAFLRGFAQKQKPAEVATPNSGHPMQEALMAPSVPVLNLRIQQPKIKLTHLAIMKDKELLKGNATPAEIALKAFEANQKVADAFNAFTPDCVKKFVTNPKLVSLVPTFVGLTPEKQALFLQKYAQSFEAALSPASQLSLR